MKKAFLSILFCLVAASAIAVPVICTLSWDAPMVLADGSPLDPTRLAGYRVYIAIDADLDPDGEFTAVQNNQGPQEISIDLDPRIQPYELKFGVIAVLNDGKVSQMSEIGSQSFRLQSSANPGPPTNLKIILECRSAGCEIIVL
jgi:hypothetical protein